MICSWETVQLYWIASQAVLFSLLSTREGGWLAPGSRKVQGEGPLPSRGQAVGLTRLSCATSHQVSISWLWLCVGGTIPASAVEPLTSSVSWRLGVPISTGLLLYKVVVLGAHSFQRRQDSFSAEKEKPLGSLNTNICFFKPVVFAVGLALGAILDCSAGA